MTDTSTSDGRFQDLTLGDIRTGKSLTLQEVNNGAIFKVGICKHCSALYIDLAMHAGSHGVNHYE